MALQSLVVVLVVLVLAVAAGSCGGDSSRGEPSAQPEAVTGVLNAQRGQAGPPDAGSRGGHGADRYLARADGPTVTIAGRVTPATAVVQVRARSGRRLARADVAGDGAFTATLPGVSVGTTVFELSATAGRLRPWTTDIVVTRTHRTRRKAAARAVPRRAGAPATAPG